MVTPAIEQTWEELALAGMGVQALVCIGAAASLRGALGARPSTGAGVMEGLRRCCAAAFGKLRGCLGTACDASLPVAMLTALAGSAARLVTVMMSVHSACMHAAVERLSTLVTTAVQL
jgi:hypothetical protein